jgi:alkanesulfonate monooxygenase SsuD/methylene tetrahydromethanopterin reductase-like flavin-dependent oxidoreductase (luciferase family)
MHAMYFTEQPMAAYDSQEGLRYGATALTFSNKHYDSSEGSRLYNEYLEDYIVAEESGADGIMLNEHHNAPFCMQARTNMFAAILAAATKRVKIVILGNPLPLSDNPVQLAEELAMIDMISKGRLVSGFVRGGGQEQLANGVNPAFNRERFVEAHSLVQKIWTEHGPFRWEGTHYQHRVVNPWAVPMQKPYPRVWIPGVLSKETIVWTAQQRYPYIALNTAIDHTKEIFRLYSDTAAECGYVAGPENFGYLIRVHVQEDEEKALRNARQFMWMQGEFTGLAHPVWANPAGYFSPSGRRGFVEFATGRAINPRGSPTFEDQIASTMIIAGTPKQVTERLKYLIEHTRPGIMGIWANDGTVSQADRQSCIKLLFKEVMPEVKAHADKLGLKDPWEAGAPVHLRYSTDLQAARRAAAE